MNLNYGIQDDLTLASKRILPLLKEGISISYSEILGARKYTMTGFFKYEKPHFMVRIFSMGKTKEDYRIIAESKAYPFIEEALDSIEIKMEE